MANDRSHVVRIAFYILHNRFYGKEDIEVETNLTRTQLRWIGDNEIFETTFKSKIYADLLNGKCKVWDIMEYDGRTGLGAHDYYMRARFNIKSVL